MKVLVIPADFQ